MDSYIGLSLGNSGAAVTDGSTRGSVFAAPGHHVTSHLCGEPEAARLGGSCVHSHRLETRRGPGMCDSVWICLGVLCVNVQMYDE